MFSFAYSILSVVMFSELLKLTVMWFPKTFTIGEAMVVVQSIMLFTTMAFTRVLYHDIGDRSDSEMDFVFDVVMVSVF